MAVSIRHSLHFHVQASSAASVPGVRVPGPEKVVQHTAWGALCLPVHRDACGGW